MKNNNSANFKLRLLASLADLLIQILVFVLCVFFISLQPNLSSAVSTLFLVTILVFLNPLFILELPLFTHYFGGSPGKLLTGLQLTDEKGNRLSFKRIMFRHTIGYSFSWLVFGIGYLSVIKDPQKQAWHDKTVGSKVLVTQNLWPLALLTCIITLSFSTYFGIKSFEIATNGPLAVEAKSLWQQYQNDIREKKVEKSKTNPGKPSPIINNQGLEVSNHDSIRFLTTPTTNICLGQVYDIEWIANYSVRQIRPYLVSAINPAEKFALYPEKKPFAGSISMTNWKGSQSWTIGDVTDSSKKPLQVKPGSYVFATDINEFGTTRTIYSSQFIISDCSDPNRPGSPNNPLQPLP